LLLAHEGEKGISKRAGEKEIAQILHE